MNRTRWRQIVLSAVFPAVLLPAVELTALAAGSGPDASAAGTVNMSAAYGITTVLSLLLVIGYCALVRRRNVWLFLLHVSVLVVNLGYFALSISKTLEEALLANRISYLGSVFLPLCMLVAIMDVCRVKYRKWFLGALLCISVAVFLLAASPGYLDCYYQDVSLTFVSGMAKLDKVYGPLHRTYLFYLLAYFGMMIGTILISISKKRTVAHKHAAILLTIVLLNIAIWFVEQLISLDFEFLSLSYIVSELLLLMLYGMMQDYGILPGSAKVEPAETQAGETAAPEAGGVGRPEPSGSPPQESMSTLSDERIGQIMAHWPALSMLTAREADVLHSLLENKKRKIIAEELNVTEHTVKKHTANIFSKFGVSSRSELFAKADREPPHL